MTFQKYVGRKTIFAIISIIIIFYLLFRYGSFDFPFPFQLVIPILVLAWLIIGLIHLIKYARSQHKPKQK